MSTSFRPILASPWLWLTLLAIVVGFLGGSSRPDQVQLAVLRPLVCLFFLPALFFITRQNLLRAKALVALFCFLAFWMCLQLVPLPPDVWQALPGRDVVAELDSLSGPAVNWRPISLVPSRGWNALASLVVPGVGLLLALAIGAKARVLLFAIAGLGLLDAALGLLQIVSGRDGLLYFYSITNRGSAVGMFANENHSGFLSAVVLLVIARLITTAKTNGDPKALRLAYAPAFILVLIAALISGSRAAFAMSALALVFVSILVVVWLRSMPTENSRHKHRALKNWQPRALAVGVFCLVVALVLTFLAFGRVQALEAFLNRSAMEDLRLLLWPILRVMACQHWLTGTGFGSFEEVYHLYEPTVLLSPNYLNQAHNDWLQLVIEGGLPAVLLLLSLLFWFVGRSLSSLGAGQASWADLLFWVGVFGIVAASSLVDYPLRTPAFQLVAIWLLLSFALERDEPEIVPVNRAK